MAGREGRKIYSTRGWAWTRRAVLRAAGYRCAGCGRGAREVDHIVAVARGGAAFELSNLQPLCRRCHHAKTRAERGVQLTPWRLLVEELRCAKNNTTGALALDSVSTHARPSRAAKELKHTSPFPATRLPE